MCLKMISYNVATLLLLNMLLSRYMKAFLKHLSNNKRTYILGMLTSFVTVAVVSWIRMC